MGRLLLKDIVSVIDEFLIGDINSHKILKPELVKLDDVILSQVVKIEPMHDSIVVWLSIGTSEI